MGQAWPDRTRQRSQSAFPAADVVVRGL